MTAQTSEKERAWLLPGSRKTGAGPGLYLVATPIGNLGDITLRALDTLAEADLVVCEDTRVTGKLLNYFGLSKKMIPYNDHNADKQRGGILERLREGQIVALVSDAGTPLISDPGYRLVRACIADGIAVSAVPGANAVLSALQLSGLPSDAFCFAGFLPTADGARRKILKRWKDVAAPVIFFETGPRLLKTLKAMREELGDREIAVAREMTKMFEEVKRGSVSELMQYYAEPPKGEIVLVVGPPEVVEVQDADVEKQLRTALKTMSTKEAAAFVAAATGRARKELYAMALKIGK